MQERRLDPAMLAGEFTPDEIGRITKMRIDRENLSNNTYRVFQESIAVLQQEKERSDADVGTVSELQALINAKRK